MQAIAEEPTPPELDGAAASFARAYLDRGNTDAGARARLRARSSAEFGAALLRAPAPATGPARIVRLSTALLSRDPPRALLTGSARRGGEPEEFGFVFESRAGRWLAVGPAE